jgi:Uma2 family endonuclease
MDECSPGRAGNPIAARLHLTPRDHGRPLTLEEFAHAGWEEGSQYELIDGRLAVHPLPEMPHDCLREWLREKLDDYTEQHPEIINNFFAPAWVFLPPQPWTTVVNPDVAAYHNFPLHLRFRLDWPDVSPFVVAEILWEDTADKDLVRNLALYLRVPSIREYWIIDPRISADTPSLTMHRRRGQRWQKPIELAAGETYTTRLLPDFTLVLDPRQ